MNQEVIYNNELEEELQNTMESAKPYFFAPAITKQRTVNGRHYIVRSYFTGGKDFGKTMQQLAVKQADKNAR